MANSPEYRTIVKCTPQLTTAFRNDLVQLSNELLAKDLISDTNVSDLENQHNGANCRASKLLELIRNKIQLHPKNNYQDFIDVLMRRLSDHKNILEILDEQYKKLGEFTHLSVSTYNNIICITRLSVFE